MASYFGTAWKVLKKLADKAAIAVGAYSVGDSNNDVEKLTKVLTKINNVNTNESSSTEKYIVIGLLVVLGVIATAFIARYTSVRAVKKDRQIRMQRRESVQV